MAKITFAIFTIIFMAKAWQNCKSAFTHFYPFLPILPILPIFTHFTHLTHFCHSCHSCKCGRHSQRDTRYWQGFLETPLPSNRTSLPGPCIYTICTLYIQYIYTTHIECGRHTQRDTRDWQGFLETPLPSNRTSLHQLRTSNPTLESPHACHRMRQMAKWQKWVKFVKWVKMGKMGKCHMSHCILPFLPFFAIFAIPSNMPIFLRYFPNRVVRQLAYRSSST